MWGAKDPKAHVNVYIGPRAQPKEKPLLGHGENPPWHGVAEDEGGNLLLVVTLPITPRSRKSTKVENDNESV